MFYQALVFQHWNAEIKVDRREQLYMEEQSLNASRLAIEDLKFKR